MKFCPAIVESEPVGCVNDPDKRVSLFKVVSPVTAECFLAAHVPYSIINTFSSAGCSAGQGAETKAKGGQKERRMFASRTFFFPLSFIFYSQMFSLKLQSRKSRLANCITFVEMPPSLMIPSVLFLHFYQLRSMYVNYVLLRNSRQ